MQRILVFGGSFDPVHKAHVSLANDVLLTINAEKCLWVPCKQRVFDKQQQASARQRFEMLRLALLPYSQKHAICSLEIERDSPSYTYLTLQALKSTYPKDTWFAFLMGADNFLEFTRWHAFDKFHALCNIIVYQRGEPDLSGLENMSKQCGYRLTQDVQTFLVQRSAYVYYMPGHFPSASSRIREAIANQQPNITDLDPTVLEYIQKHGLYQQKKP